MMIWDFIRDFFVQYIFGGTTSNSDAYFGYIGYLLGPNGFEVDATTNNGYMVSIGESYSEDLGTSVVSYISVGDWLSTTATIIVMCLIVFLLICLVRWIFRAVSSAMLLK